MKLFYAHGVFILKCGFDEREIARKSGFRWHTTKKLWYTPSPIVAARLRVHAVDSTAQNEIDRHAIVYEPFGGQLDIPPNEMLLPFQMEAALYALARNRSYLALDPGLGKTPISAIIAATLSHLNYQFVYICPPFLTRNTVAEFNRFAPDLYCGIIKPKGVIFNGGDVLIVPDSLIATPRAREATTHFVAARKERGQKVLLFVDEAHRYKNDLAARTKALLGRNDKELGRIPGIADEFDRVVYLSGTPMPNRPMELFPILSHSASETIQGMSKFEFGFQYCAGFKDDWGYNFDGASNMNELATKVKEKFMLRFRKKDVMKDLPPKTEEMVVLSEELSDTHLTFEANLLSKYSPEDLMKGIIRVDLGKDELPLATYRRELGTRKVKPVAEFIREQLEETDENVIVFAIHKETIHLLQIELEKYLPLVITGQTPMNDRHTIVKAFQDPKSTCRVIIGNIQAMGVGLTLTRASRVIFAEFSWTPSDNDQASDRAHRIGQKENVLVQYLVYPNSVDKAVIETVLRKRKVTTYV